jgi:hypothetical protein
LQDEHTALCTPLQACEMKEPILHVLHGVQTVSATPVQLLETYSLAALQV